MSPGESKHVLLTRYKSTYTCLFKYLPFFTIDLRKIIDRRTWWTSPQHRLHILPTNSRPTLANIWGRFKLVFAISRSRTFPETHKLDKLNFLRDCVYVSEHVLVCQGACKLVRAAGRLHHPPRFVLVSSLLTNSPNRFVTYLPSPLLSKWRLYRSNLLMSVLDHL